MPLSWQRPLASLASISSCASLLTAAVLTVLRIDAALGRRLDVVLEAERADRVARARGGGVARDEARRHDAAVGQLEDRLAAAVGAGAERAGGHVRLAALGEEVDVGVGVAGRERGDHLPGRAGAAGPEGRVRGAGGERRIRVVEGNPVARERRVCGNEQSRRGKQQDPDAPHDVCGVPRAAPDETALTPAPACSDDRVRERAEPGGVERDEVAGLEPAVCRRSARAPAGSPCRACRTRSRRRGAAPCRARRARRSAATCGAAWRRRCASAPAPFRVTVASRCRRPSS